ncbi:hypothetical protein [Rhodococcus jostii]|uniref:hypothetical protein n=1 Tax=Rhodococcus jostii TaxID=132919 RepID=UPI003630DB15
MDIPAAPSNDYPIAFEDFWAVYPKKDQKRDALKAWKSAIKRADNDELIAGAHRYAQDPNRSDTFTKLGAGWLRDDMWLDGPLAPRNDRPNKPAAVGGLTARELNIAQAERFKSNPNMELLRAAGLEPANLRALPGGQ